MERFSGDQRRNGSAESTRSILATLKGYRLTYTNVVSAQTTLGAILQRGFRAVNTLSTALIFRSCRLIEIAEREFLMRRAAFKLHRGSPVRIKV